METARGITSAGPLVLSAVVGALLLIVLTPSQAAARSFDGAPNNSNISDDSNRTVLQPTSQSSDPSNAPEETQPQETQGRAGIKRAVKVKAKPFRELLTKVQALHGRGEINLSDPVDVVIDAERNVDGSLSNVSVVRTVPSNPALAALAGEFAQTLSASRALRFLNGARRLRMTLNLDGQQVAGRLAFDAASGARAAEMARDYAGLIALGRLFRKGRSVEATVLNNMTVSASGKQLLMKLEMSRQTAGNLLLKLLPPN